MLHWLNHKIIEFDAGRIGSNWLDFAVGIREIMPSGIINIWNFQFHREGAMNISSLSLSQAFGIVKLSCPWRS